MGSNHCDLVNNSPVVKQSNSKHEKDASFYLLLESKVYRGYEY